MVSRQPVLVTVLIECASLRWHVAGIDHEGKISPLVCSDAGNLAAYIGEELDDQVSFLRHRLSGVLQRGCDRLWARDQKPCRLVIATDRLFPEATAELTQLVADHFVEWMTNPPVVFLLLGDEANEYKTLAGQWSTKDREAFDTGLSNLLEARSQDQLWELIRARQPK